MFRRKNQLWRLILTLIVVLGIGGVLQRPADGKTMLGQGVQRLLTWGQNNSTFNYQHDQLPPTKQQAMVVLKPVVRQQLGDNIIWNGHGAFIINNDRSGLNANVASAPYAVNHIDSKGRPWRGDAWLNRTTRQYQNRAITKNGATDWKPAGFLQAHNLTGGYNHAYDRGHLLGYALVGGIRGFDASESNPQNVATQTAWANEARSSTSTGQNYYEGIVRKALDQGKQVRYRVTDIYSGSSIVPAGAHIQAQSKDGSVDFNVFVPNVQRNIDINYATGAVRQK